MATPLAPGFRFAGQTRHRLSYQQIKRLAQAYGLPGDAIAQIAKGESSQYADIQQRDPGDGMVGYGLLQMTPNAWGKNSAAYKHMQKLGGIQAMRDPEKNMAMARFLYKSAGNKLTPWYGTKFLTNRAGEGTLGPVDRSRIPSGASDGGGSGGGGGGTRLDVTSHRIAGKTTALPGRTFETTVPTLDTEAYERAKKLSIVGQLIARRNPQSILLRSGLLSTSEPSLSEFMGQQTTASRVPGQTVRTPGMTALSAREVKVPGGGGGGGSARAAAVASGRGGTFKITGPNPGRIQPQVRHFAQRISGVLGEPVVGSDGTGHSKFTTTGNVSEHFTGAASDIPARGERLVRLGQAALIAAGKDPKWARKQRKGLFNVYSGGKRYQIIFGTNDPALGGDHTDHLHIGVHG